MENNNQISELAIYECKEINGGSFGWDAGWLLGNLITGNFMTPVGTVEALTDYAIHYQE